jgi:hypothetical protein
MALTWLELVEALRRTPDVHEELLRVFDGAIADIEGVSIMLSGDDGHLLSGLKANFVWLRRKLED